MWGGKCKLHWFFFYNSLLLERKLVGGERTATLQWDPAPTALTTGVGRVLQDLLWFFGTKGAVNGCDYSPPAFTDMDNLNCRVYQFFHSAASSRPALPGERWLGWVIYRSRQMEGLGLIFPLLCLWFRQVRGPTPSCLLPETLLLAEGQQWGRGGESWQQPRPRSGRWHRADATRLQWQGGHQVRGSF